MPSRQSRPSMYMYMVFVPPWCLFPLCHCFLDKAFHVRLIFNDVFFELGREPLFGHARKKKKRKKKRKKEGEDKPTKEGAVRSKMEHLQYQ